MCLFYKATNPLGTSWVLNPLRHNGNSWFLLFSRQDPFIKETQWETDHAGHGDFAENKQLREDLEDFQIVPGWGAAQEGVCPQDRALSPHTPPPHPARPAPWHLPFPNPLLEPGLPASPALSIAPRWPQSQSPRPGPGPPHTPPAARPAVLASLGLALSLLRNTPFCLLLCSSLSGFAFHLEITELPPKINPAPEASRGMQRGPRGWG